MSGVIPGYIDGSNWTTSGSNIPSPRVTTGAMISRSLNPTQPITPAISIHDESLHGLENDVKFGLQNQLMLRLFSFGSFPSE